MQAIKPRSFLFVSLLAFCFAIDLAWYGWVGFIRDDAYITFRYARNIANGLGFVYNAGEHVYGTSSPGLALLLAGWLKFFHNPWTVAVGLDILAGILSLAFAWKLLESFSVPLVQRVTVAFILLWSDKLLVEMMAGMETALVIACMMASLYFMVKEEPIFAGLAAGLMLWFRLDSALWIAAVVIIFLWNARRNTFIFFCVAGIAYLPWAIFAQLYFGSAIPLTAIAKQVAYGWGPTPWSSRFQVLSGWLAPYTIVDHPSLARTLAVITDGVALAGVWLYRKVIWVHALAVFFLLQTTALIALNMTVEQRYFTTSLYVLLILFGLGFSAAWTQIRSKWIQGGLAAFYIISAFYFAMPRMIHLRDHQRYVYELSLKQMGEWFQQNSPSDAVIYLEPLGYVGYYAERKMLDDVGFATPVVIPYKRARIDSYSIATSLQPDYMVLHCDDAQRAPDGFPFEMVVRFDPLGFETGQEWADKAVQRTACYQINKNKTSH